MVNKIRLVLLFVNIYPHFIFFANGYLFYLFCVVKNNAVQHRLNVVVSFDLGNSVN